MMVDLDPGTLYYDDKITANQYINLIMERDTNNHRVLKNAQESQRAMERALPKKTQEPQP